LVLFRTQYYIEKLNKIKEGKSLTEKKDGLYTQKKSPQKKEQDIKESEDKIKDWDVDFIP